MCALNIVMNIRCLIVISKVEYALLLKIRLICFVMETPLMVTAEWADMLIQRRFICDNIMHVCHSQPIK